MDKNKTRKRYKILSENLWDSNQSCSSTKFTQKQKQKEKQL